jgi:pyroglutamyl-peptidase
VLLTGFGPFPGVPENVSGTLVRHLVRAARRSMQDCRFASAVLPTEWARAPRTLAKLHADHVPILALHFGVAAETRGFRIETEARNDCRASSDARGRQPLSQRLFDDGPDVRRATLAAGAIAAELRTKGYPVSLSDDAGGYLCNAALYHSLVLAEAADAGCRVGFVHIPANLDGPPLSLEQALAGALEIVRLALEPARPRISLTSV